MHPAYDRGGLLHKVEGVLFVRGRVALRLLRVAFVGLPTVTTTWHHGGGGHVAERASAAPPQSAKRQAKHRVTRLLLLPRETGNILARVP